MTLVRPGQRQRARAPKVRSGCITCKVRRVKCDEARPVCSRCSHGSRPCQYTEAVYDPSQGLGATSLADYTLSLVPSGGPDESRSLQFLVERTLTQFSTFFPDELWNPIVIQLSYSETSIRHALVALASYHEHFLRHRRGSGDETSFGLYHYNRAIRELVSKNDTTSPPIHVQLLSNLIFVCIEILRGKYISAVNLFKCGLQIADQRRRENRKKRNKRAIASPIHKTIQRIETIYVIMGVQINQIFGPKDPKFSLRPGISPSLRFIQIAPAFRSLSEAKETFVKVILNVAKMAIMPAERDRKIRYDQLSQWSGAFENYISMPRTSPLSDSEKRAIALLRFHSGYCSLVLRQPLSLALQDPLLFDQYTDEFRHILKHASVALGLDGLEGVDLKQEQQVEVMPEQWHFHLDIGVTPCLFAIAFLCREPSVRRSAIGLMRRARMQEGIWNSEAAFRIAERIVAIEENGLGEIKSCKDIPAEARIFQIGVDIDPEERRVWVQYGQNGRHGQELIDW